MTPSNDVFLTGANSTNNLGVLRNLARVGIPVTLLVSDPRSMVRYSRYPAKKLNCPDPNLSETDFVKFLLSLGSRRDHKPVIIPTGDAEVLILSKYYHELEKEYLLPISTFDTIDELVNKRKFYALLDSFLICHPETHLSVGLSQFKAATATIGYPYLIKPAYSHLFSREFKTKNLVIHNENDLNSVITGLMDSNNDFFVQEFIPGDQIYMCYLSMNKNSEPIGICGYDKVRQCNGNGSLCKSRWRSDPIEITVELLKTIGYRGLAEAEFKMDPRDGKYKLLEINARTTTQSALAAGCGINMEYLTYLDTVGEPTGGPKPPAPNVVWMDEFLDLRSWVAQWTGGKLGIKDVLRSLKGRRVYAVAAWNDPLPFLISTLRHVFRGLRYFTKRLSWSSS